MRKNLLKSLLATVCLLGSTNVWAYDFEVDGVYYDVISLTDFTCKITSGDEKYVGDFIVPETVNYSNKVLTVIEIGERAFSYCYDLTSVTIPNSVTKINENAFVFCESLMNISIPNSVVKIDRYAFRDCNSLESVIIPNSVTEIGSHTFYNCSNLENVTIPNSVTEIGSHTFNGCSNLESVILPDSITKIGEYMFASCKNLKSVTIPDAVKTIEEGAFRFCESITTLTIPNSVKIIENGAFTGCTALTSIVLGKSVKTIGSSVFYNCANLTSLYSLATTPPNIDISYSFTNNHYMTVYVYVPQEALEAYQSADVWKNFWYLQDFDTTIIKSSMGEEEKPIYYDLRGNRLNAPKRGLNIIKGKKMMMK